MRIPVHRVNGRSSKGRARARAVVVAWAVVDDDVALGDLAGAFWTIDGAGYAKAYLNGRLVFLHHVVVGREPGLDVSHENGNKLDCRRENLVHRSRSRNMLNTADGPTSACTSGFRGVTRDDRSRQLARPWRGKVTVDGRIHQTERFASPYEAAVALNALRQNLGVPEDLRVREYPK